MEIGWHGVFTHLGVIMIGGRSVSYRRETGPAVVVPFHVVRTPGTVAAVVDGQIELSPSETRVLERLLVPAVFVGIIGIVILLSSALEWLGWTLVALYALALVAGPV